MHPKRPVKVIGLLLFAMTALIGVNASSAQANYVLLLNGSPVSLLNLSLEGLHGYLTVANGLKILCEGAVGSAHVETVGGGAGVSGTALAVFEGCEWVGAEETCTISDEFENPGELHVAASGSFSMNETSYSVTATSSEFGTLYSEGPLCTIPEEEVFSGTLSATIPKAGAESNTTVKLASLKADAIFLGKSKVTELVCEFHIRDADNPNATWAIHLG